MSLRLMTRLACLLGFAILAVLPSAGQEKKKDDVADLLEGKDKGPKFRLVTADDANRGVGELVYWRTMHGTVAAQTTPVRFRVADGDIIAPVLNQSAGADTKAAYTYPTEGHIKLKPGRHLLTPGNIPIEVKGTEPASSHPAIKIVNGEVRIRCAPVRLDVVDTRGAPVPSPIHLTDEKGSLLREEARFSVLIAWLPVGAEYQSSLGSFALAGDGKIKGVRLANEVSVTAEGLRKTVPAAQQSKPAATETIQVATHGPTGKPTAQCRFYVPAQVSPQPAPWGPATLLLAVSKREYQQATGKAFAAADIKYQVEDETAASGVVLAVPPERDAASDRATRALGTTADDLAWLSAKLPVGLAGPVQITLQTATLGSTRFTVLVADAAEMALVPHRWRTVFAQTETGTYQVLMKKGDKGGEARVMLQSEPADKNQPITLGTLMLPAADEGEDSRLFTVRMADLPPGRHQLWIETAAGGRSGKLPLTVVSWLQKSPFLTHSMSGCTTCWPTTEEGLTLLERAGLEMVSATGATSQLTTAMPRIDESLAARLAQVGIPGAAALALRPADNDRLLERLLRHRLRLIDLAVCRESGLYMEGLSYHHSYPASVERMIRRMQIFTQQTADYASFWGVNYSWFPQMYGYAEGGVPSDAHVHDRNRVLLDNVKAAGFAPVSREDYEWLRKNKYPDDPQQRDKAVQLIKQAIAHRNASQALGWGRHNQMYNQAIRDIRPGTVCTLFENAGHDESKRLRSMFNDMNAQCYESYTDFGDWPMSSAFVTDWSHGQSPGQPVWLTTCWGASSEAKMKALFHGFARGLEGGGVPMQANYELAELARRGTGLKFVSQYGSLTPHAKPDRRVAILSRNAHVVLGRMIWDAHAVYYHLTRLGWPAAIIADEELGVVCRDQKVMRLGIPDDIQVLVLVKEDTPFEPDTKRAIEEFQKRGGKVLTVAGCKEPIAGAIDVPITLKHLWDLKGFHADNHALLWKEFDQVRGPLAEAMAKTGLPALATMDPQHGFAVTMDVGPVRYVAVIADSRGTHANVFEPTAALPLSLEGTGWVVRDLVKQQTLPATVKNGRTEITVDLMTEPTTLLALYTAAPATIKVSLNDKVALGNDLVVEALVGDADGASLGAVPLRLIFTTPDGVERETLFRAAGDTVRLPLALHDRPGKWKVTVQELLTGQTATSEVTVGPATKESATAEAVGPVHVVNPAHVQQFVAHPGEKLVIVEPEQGHLLPVAKSLVESLQKAGVSARLWQVKPEEYDTQPVRWYPTPADEQRLKAIADGKLIGVRENLRPFIDTLKRVHVPERGGYHDIDPPYLVGRDCVVFSGGRLADSLRAVSPWMASPSVPGKGQGRLVVCFSPFMAERHAVAVIANDIEGLIKSANALAEALATKPKVVAAAATPDTPITEIKTTQEVTAVPRPYGGYTPVQRVMHLLAADTGKAALILRGKQDNVAFVDEQGKVTGTVQADLGLARYAQIDEQGRLQLPVRRVTATHPGWDFPTEAEYKLLCINQAGKLQHEQIAYSGSMEVPDFEGGLRWARDGVTAAFGRAGGLVYTSRSREPSGTSPPVRLGSADLLWQRYSDLGSVHTRYGILYPRHPVGATFSPDGRYLLFTMDSRPPFGGLGSAMPRPMDCETILLDLKTGQKVWSLRVPDSHHSTYAIHSGFAALSRDATLAAFIDYDGAAFLVDKTGKVIRREKVTEAPHDAGHRHGPYDGIGVWMSDDDRTAAFGFRKVLLIAQADRVVKVPVEGLTSACASPDGARVVCSSGDGKVRAFDPTGKQLWEVASLGAAPLVASAGTKGTLVATGAGELILLDPAGKELRRTNVVESADRQRHELSPAAEFVRRPGPIDYVEPDTLPLAQKHLSAKEVARWHSDGAGHDAFGKRFYPLGLKAEVTAGSEAGECFVHLVYRLPGFTAASPAVHGKPAAKTEKPQSLKVATNGRDGPETFWLDLPTPEYRVVDIPVRGPKVSVAVTAEEPAEIAELSLWSYRWPGFNLAYVKPAGVDSKNVTETKEKPKGGEDILSELDGKKAPGATPPGKLKECKIWWPNTDPDNIRGPWLPAPLDPLQVVDGRRFGNGKVAMWSNKWGHFPPTRGGFFTVDLGETTTPAFVATYDRADRQSAVAVNLVVFTFDPANALTGGSVLGGAVGNDQFWRILPVTKDKVKVLGVHVIKDADNGAGLSEVEVYR